MVLDPVRVEPQLLGILTEPEEIATRSPAEDSEAKPHPLVARSNPRVHCVFHTQNVNHAPTSGPPEGRQYMPTNPADPMRTGPGPSPAVLRAAASRCFSPSLGETQQVGAGPADAASNCLLSARFFVLGHACELHVEVSMPVGREVTLARSRDERVATTGAP